MIENKYPEHEKLQAVKEKSQAIGEFIEWLRSVKGIMFSKYENVESDCDDAVYDEKQGKYTHEELVPQWIKTNDILAEYYDIDLDKLEQEKRAMLEEVRKHNMAERDKKYKTFAKHGHGVALE